MVKLHLDLILLQGNSDLNAQVTYFMEKIDNTLLQIKKLFISLGVMVL